MKQDENHKSQKPNRKSRKEEVHRFQRLSQIEEKRIVERREPDKSVGNCPSPWPSPRVRKQGEKAKTQNYK
jgi:hypothetical protein